MEEQEGEDARAGTDESEDVHLARLAEAVCAIHGLQVVRRVPVRVEDDDLRAGLRVSSAPKSEAGSRSRRTHSVGGGQVEPDTAGSGRDEEAEDVARRVVELVDEGHACARGRPSQRRASQVVKRSVRRAELRNDTHARLEGCCRRA